MKNKIFILLTVLICSVAFRSSAQSVGEFSYQVSFPMGEFNDFIGKTSWVGFSGGGRKYVNDRLSIGGTFSWFYFPDKRGKETVDMKDQGVFTGSVTNFTNIYALSAFVQYDLKDFKEKRVPYVRGGIGGAYQNQRQDIGIYSFQSDGVQFLLNGEAGFRFSNDGMKALTLAVTYHYLPAASDMVSTSFFGIKLGFSGAKP